MLIILASDCTEVQRRHVIDAVRRAGCRVEETRAGNRETLTVLGDLDRIRHVPFKVFPGVAKVVSLTPAHTLTSLAHQKEPSVVSVGNARFGDGSFTVIAGPCAVENGDQLLKTALVVKEAGAHVLRGGAWKPRTSPYAFRGLGVRGLKLLREVSQEVGLPTVTEVMDARHLEAVVSNADMIQIGTRNMSNFDLLVEVGRSGHPVLLKRGRSATISDWLYAAEYILAQGNPKVVLCERGVRGFDTATRNILDLAAVPAVRERTHLPIIIDPSHGTGVSRYVAPMARAAVAAGADGVMIEVHHRPERALSDAAQALRPRDFRELTEDLRLLAKVCRRPNSVEDRPVEEAEDGEK
jgi:3-deoxy-7-phosphoheptulonate synthase